MHDAREALATDAVALLVKARQQIGIGLARGAELAGIEIPGGELAQIGDLVKGFDIAGACFGTVRLDSIIDGSAVAPGDVIIGPPGAGGGPRQRCRP
jgi:phosphoribosylaminoimidazole (AIR) synthetase